MVLIVWTLQEQLAEARSSAEARKSSEEEAKKLQSKLDDLTGQLSQQTKQQESQTAEVCLAELLASLARYSTLQHVVHKAR